HASRHLRPSRTARAWRRGYPHRTRIYGALLLGPRALPRLPAPERHVRHRARVSVYSKAPTADRAVTRWLATVAQHHGDEFRDRGDRRRPDSAHRHRTVPAGAPPNYALGRRGWNMAVLLTAPVRDVVLGKRRRGD